MPVARTITAMEDHIAIYAGSFDPITSGHLDVISRARGMFDQIIVGIGHNPEKQSLFPFEERVEIATTLIEELVQENPDLAPVTVKQYGGLTVDFAKNSGASALLRGIRNVTDLAMETQLAITNRQVANMETVFIVTGEAYAFTSSSLIRQIAALGGDVERLGSIIPPLVINKIKALQSDPTSSLHTLGQDAHIE
jgi:pantetheine-phosphate adenylyltransferase